MFILTDKIFVIEGKMFVIAGKIFVIEGKMFVIAGKMFVIAGKIFGLDRIGSDSDTVTGRYRLRQRRAMLQVTGSDPY